MIINKRLTPDKKKYIKLYIIKTQNDEVLKLNSGISHIPMLCTYETK